MSFGFCAWGGGGRAGLGLHVSECHTVGGHMPRL